MILAALLFVSTTTAGAQTLLVAPIQSDDPKIAKLATEFAVSAVEGGSYRRIVTLVDAPKLKARWKRRPCTRRGCFVELAKAAGADHALVIRVQEVTGGTTIIGRIIDTDRGGVVRRRTHALAHASTPQLLHAIDEVAGALVDKSVPTKVSAAPRSSGSSRAKRALREMRASDESFSGVQSRRATPARGKGGSYFVVQERSGGSDAAWIGGMLFGISYLGYIGGVFATDPYDSQIPYAFIPVIGPILVDGENGSSQYQAINYSASVLQGVSLALLFAGLASNTTTERKVPVRVSAWSNKNDRGHAQAGLNLSGVF